MAKQGPNWCKVKERAKGRSARRSDQEGDIAAHREIAAFENRRDIKWLEAMLQENLSEYHRRKVLVSIDWLREHPERTLGDRQVGWRDYYSRLWRALKSGHYDPEKAPDPERVKEGRSRAMLRHYQKCERRESRPEWMRNTDLLPKKPPGRGTQ